MKFRQMLTKLLVETKQTQAKLAHFVGVKPNTVSDWINKGTSPKIEHIYLIADFFSVSFDYLFKGQEINTNNSIRAGDLSNNKIVTGQDNSITYNSGAEPVSDAVLVCDDAIEIDKIIKSLNPRARAKFLSKVYDLAEEFKE